MNNSNKTTQSKKPNSRLSFFQLILLIIPAIAVLIIDADSFLLISFTDSDIQIRLWLALLVMVILPLLVSIFKSVTSLLSGQWYKQNQTLKNERRLQAGLNSYLEGDWYDCVAQLKPLNRKSYSMTSYVFGARAAKQLGKKKLASQWLIAARSIAMPHQIAAHLEQVNQFIEIGDYESADDCIKSLASVDHKRHEVIRYKKLIDEALAQKLLTIEEPA